jgi:7-cyano-7-deazaguanine synthase
VEEARSSRSGSATVILSSGGIDSTAAIALAVAEKRDCTTMFVDYGQAAANAEERSSAAVANHYGVNRRVLTTSGLSFGSGEIRGRNSFLVHAALLAFPANNGSIVLGIHAGTGYRDCDPDFVELTQRSLDFHAGGAITLVAPFIDASKASLFAIAEALSIPVGLTFSCEAGSEPCRECLSCRDRASFARA